MDYHFTRSKFQSYSYDINEDDTNKRPKIHIFWTGGWDSTFRMLQLSKKRCHIQPIYLDDRRTSTDYELKAIDTIANKIEKLKTTKCKIYDLLILDTSKVASDDEITQSYNDLYSQKFMGSQYDWLARFAKGYKGIELCIHKDDKALEVIETFGSVKKVSNEDKGDYFALDQECQNDDLIKVFGNYHFPLLHYTKLGMRDEADAHGFTEIMKDTWFCHTPISGEPCGLCNPCKYSIEEGMKHRFSTNAINRYRYEKIKRALRQSTEAILTKIKIRTYN